MSWPHDGASDGPRWYPSGVMGSAVGRLPDRLPPHNLEAEAGVLGSILLDPATLADVLAAELRPEHFYRDAHQLVYRAILCLHDAGSPVDPITLADELGRRGERERVSSDVDGFLGELLASVPHVANARYYAGIVRQKAVGRSLLLAASETIQAVYSDAYTAEDLVALAGRGVAEAEADIPRPEGEAAPAEPKGYPKSPRPAAFHGLAGEFVRLVEPHTESDPLAVLVQFLTMAGNVFGSRPHWKIEATRHKLNLFSCIVGISAQGRKGTSFDLARHAFEGIDDDWMKKRLKGGMSSGEGFIDTIKDPVWKTDLRTNADPVMVHPGVDDKRALWVETEFGSVLDVAGRDGNTLSAVLRKAWDGTDLSSSTKADPVYATNPHVSIIGHVTFHELTSKLKGSDLSNGFANRILWLCVKRSKLLPHGGELHRVDFDGFRSELAEAVAFARDETFGDFMTLRRDEEADRLWEAVYPVLTAARPGTLGAVVSRGAAQSMRLAGIYAVLDRSPRIRRVHLEAGLALWDYCEESAAYIFSDLVVDADQAKVLAAVQAAGPKGLTSGQVNRRCYSGHRKSDDLARTLSALHRDGLIVPVEPDGDGRRTSSWVATSGA
jgi:hypothetical protein